MLSTSQNDCKYLLRRTMIKLKVDQYHKVIESLKKVTINNLFARSVVEKHVFGSVYVDNADVPQTFYVVHPYNISLLFGNSGNDDFNNKFRDYALNTDKIRDKYEWMQAFPSDWDSKLQAIFKDSIIKYEDNLIRKKDNIIELNTRINFKFNVDKYLDFKQRNVNKDFKIVRTDKEIFGKMKGSVVPMHFWNNAVQFYNDGVGFSLIYENKVASTAYSAFLHDDKLELGIETIEEFRGKGFAQYTCSALIDFCLENNFEPVWACRLENTGSRKLAQKLGFEPVKWIPYYRLSI